LVFDKNVNANSTKTAQNLSLCDSFTLSDKAIDT
jgi:hypothetical protein